MKHCLFKMDVSLLKSHERKQACAETGENDWWHHPQMNRIACHIPPYNTHQSLVELPEDLCNDKAPEAIRHPAQRAWQGSRISSG